MSGVSSMTREVVASAIGAAHRAADRRLDHLKDTINQTLGGRGPTISAEELDELVSGTQKLIALDIEVLLSGVNKR